ncbi:ABC transporter substrate-binding protein [Permianibacter sp. IMCC34836]|uniref:ABC transporter substrate-binding protein n=1 Tax=Permianibacter fluminis TaxID=2738515 RepID=UPI001552B867|nr:ABC transporter substrate-binding protein [Permianibacter fluminis]
MSSKLALPSVPGRFSFSSALTAAVLAALLAGCSEEPAPAPADTTTAAVAPASSLPTSVGAGEGEVDILAWPGYIERGETDKAYDWVTAFETQSSCKVNIKTAGSSDEMVSLMNQGGFDLVTASGDASLRLIAGKKVQPVNIDLIPSYKNIDPRLQNAPWHTVDGQHYGAPYQWGPNVLMYNSSVFKTPPTSWSVVFEPQNLPDGKPNKGRVQAFDGPIHIADAALYLMHKNPALGIVDPYELTEAQYNEALALLRQQKQLVHRYWHDATLQVQDFTNEGVVASGSWPYQVNTLKANGQTIASVVPQEGATGWADTTMLHAEAKHPNCAYMWLEWSLNPKVQGDVSAWFGSLPAVPAACDASELLGKDGCKTNGMDQFDQIRFWRTPVKACVSQNGNCVPYAQWSTDYIAIMSGR